MRKKIYYIGNLSVIEKDDFYLAMKMKIMQKEAENNPKEEIYARLDLEEAMKTLTARQKECILLKIDGYKVTEIAEKMGIAHPTVIEYLVSAYKKLKEFLQK